MPAPSRCTAEAPSCATSSSGATHEVAARAVVNAAGVWAGDLVADVELRPSRGTHLVLAADALPGLGVALTLPVPGERNRFVNVVPQQEGRIYVGLTDVPVDGDPPDVPEPSAAEIAFLLETTSAALAQPLEPSRRDRGLRRAAAAAPGRGPHRRPLAPARRADLRPPSRRCRHGRRRQAHDVPPDGAGRRRHGGPAWPGLDAAASPTARLPLAGAAPRATLARLAADSATPRLVRRYGTDAALVVASAREVSGLADGGAAHARRRGGRGDPRRAALRGDPRGRARRRRPARPAYPGRARGRRPRPLRARGTPRAGCSRRQRFVKSDLRPSPRRPEALPSYPCSSPGGRTQACSVRLRTTPPVL